MTAIMQRVMVHVKSFRSIVEFTNSLNFELHHAETEAKNESWNCSLSHIRIYVKSDVYQTINLTITAEVFDWELSPSVSN